VLPRKETCGVQLGVFIVVKYGGLRWWLSDQIGGLRSTNGSAGNENQVLKGILHGACTRVD
jgi:hypothetical protein